MSGNIRKCDKKPGQEKWLVGDGGMRLGFCGKEFFQSGLLPNACGESEEETAQKQQQGQKGRFKIIYSPGSQEKYADANGYKEKVGFFHDGRLLSVMLIDL